MLWSKLLCFSFAWTCPGLLTHSAVDKPRPSVGHGTNLNVNEWDRPNEELDAWDTVPAPVHPPEVRTTSPIQPDGVKGTSQLQLYRGSCKALQYPRTVVGILDSEELKYLEELFFGKLDAAYEGVYFKLWNHLNETRDSKVASIMAKVDKYVHDHFGDGFAVLNDFYSYRAHGRKLFPAAHQDGVFWHPHNHDCEGFNLWILLNHNRMNWSFNVYEIDKNPDLYDGIDFNNVSHNQKSVWQPRFKVFHERTNVPLSVGEALVLKQPEIHCTDHDFVSDGQWRLGLGFKIVKHGIDVIESEKNTLFQDPNYQRICEDPRLPSCGFGTSMWSPYNITLLHEYWRGLDSVG